ncbi:MAG: phosphatase PAP2 family protein [Humibacter sp.]
MNGTATPVALRPVRHPWLLIVIGMAGIALTVVIGLLATRSASWTAAETRALEAIASNRTALGLSAAQFVAWLFGVAVALCLSLVIAVVIWLVTRSLTRAVVFCAVVLLCWSATPAMKHIVQRPRPELSAAVVAAPHGFSFPSGHTALACALVIGLLLTLRDCRHRWAYVTGGAVVVAIVAWSRLYLGVHYPTDVAASVLLTVSAACIVIPLILNVVMPAIHGPRRRHAGGAP